MIKIEIDKELYSFLQKNAIPYVETPNDTLKRLLKIDKDFKKFAEVEKSKNFSESPQVHKKPTKSKRANLKILVREGLLNDGDILFMTNYKGERIIDEYAKVKNGKLLYKEEPYSMSRLAIEILEKNNYSPSAIRGPKMWKTEGGVTITELWLEYLKTKENKED